MPESSLDTAETRGEATRHGVERAMGIADRLATSDELSPDARETTPARLVTMTAQSLNVPHIRMTMRDVQPPFTVIRVTRRVNDPARARIRGHRARTRETRTRIREARAPVREERAGARLHHVATRRHRDFLDA